MDAQTYVQHLPVIGRMSKGQKYLPHTLRERKTEVTDVVQNLDLEIILNM